MDMIERVLRSVEAAIREMPSRYRPIDVADEIAQADSPFRAALAAARAGEAEPRHCVACGRSDGVHDATRPWQVHTVAIPDLAEQGRRLASEREDLIAQGIDPGALEAPLHPGGPAVDREALARLIHEAGERHASEVTGCDPEPWESATTAYREEAFYVADAILAARGDAATPTVTAEQVDAAWVSTARKPLPTDRLRAFLSALDIEVEGGDPLMRDAEWAARQQEAPDA